MTRQTRAPIYHRCVRIKRSMKAVRKNILETGEIYLLYSVELKPDCNILSALSHSPHLGVIWRGHVVTRRFLYFLYWTLSHSRPGKKDTSGAELALCVLTLKKKMLRIVTK